MERTDFKFRLEDLEVCDPTNLSKFYLKKGINNITLGLGITERCNLDCKKCYYRQGAFNTYKKKDMPYDFLVSILCDIGILNQIIIGLEGEPLCHPRFLDILNICNQHANSLALVTNGLLLNTHLLEIMQKLKLSSLVLSCDGYSKAKYEILHKGGKFVYRQLGGHP